MNKLFLLVLLALTLPAHAQTGRVIKIQGTKAIVDFSGSTTPYNGQILGPGGAGASSSGGPISSGPRTHYFGIGAEISSLNYSAASRSVTTFGADGRYGWNMVQWEAGPRVVFISQSTSGFSATLIELGGYFDYNFVPNVAGQSLVYAATAGLMIGSSSASLSAGSTSGTTSVSIMDIQLGGCIKWYLFPTSNTAIRIDGLYANRKGISEGLVGRSASDQTVSGFQFLAGLQMHF